MAAGDLLFTIGQGGSAALLFGEEATAALVDGTLAATLPALSFNAFACPDAKAELVVALPALMLVATAVYESKADRPVAAKSATDWQRAATRVAGAESPHQDAAAVAPGVASQWAGAAGVAAGIESVIPDALVRTRSAVAAGHREATACRNATAAAHQDGLRDRRRFVASRFAEGERSARLARAAPHQDAIRTSRSARRTRWQPATTAGRAFADAFTIARPVLVGRESWWQAGMQPGIRGAPLPVDPERPPAYSPDGHLLFRWPADGGADLIFIADAWAPPVEPVVIPIRKAYIVVNDIALIRRENSLALPALALSINIDADSWTWGWQARLHARHLDDVLPAAPGAPVEFEAVINGVHWYLLAEKVQRDRAFPQDRVAISGRGIAAELGAPYAVPTSRTNAIDRTAQQLMDDALSINGVGIGWTLDWNLTDWLVPAGAWRHAGSHIEAVARIAEAAGGYVQAHRTGKILSIKPRYPVAPWAWNGVTPDFSLPAAVTTKESVSWLENPAYNAVWISGESAGVLASVTRQGTAGDLAAPMVVDALNTHADAARQRGTSILGAAGRQQLLTLETPILANVGIYPVGSFVQFADGANSRLGIVRSLSINAGKQTRQTIEVECHA